MGRHSCDPSSDSAVVPRSAVGCRRLGYASAIGTYLVASMAYICIFSWMASHGLHDETEWSPKKQELYFRQRPPNQRDGFNVLPMTDTCNCRQTLDLDDSIGRCCTRTLRRAHKMGNIITRKLLPKEALSYLRLATDDFRFVKPGHDYRDVVVVRDLFSTIVSGYLYHRKGHECWLTPMGQPTNVSAISEEWWQTIRTTMPFPKRNRRSLCRYLADEAVEHGLHLYAHISLHFWFLQIAAQYAYAQTADDDNRTMFLCYEKLVQPDTQVDAFQQILSHLWRNRHPFAVPAVPRHVNYKGEHSNHDVSPEVRNVLRRKLVQLDKDYYGGEIANINALLGCAVM